MIAFAPAQERRDASVEGADEAVDDRAPHRGRLERPDPCGPGAGGDHRLRRRAVAARRAELAEGALHDVSRRPDVADVADGDVNLVARETGDDRPLDALDLEAQVRELRDQIGPADPAQVGEEGVLDDRAVDQGVAQRIQGVERELGALDPAQDVVVGEPVEVREGIHVRPGTATLEVERVGLDAVEESRRDPLRDLHVGRAQVLGHDRRRGAVGRSHVPEWRAPALRLRMMVDDDRDLRERFLAERGLDVHHRQRVVGAELLRGDLVDLDLERFHHREVLRPRHPAERQERGRRPRPAEEGSEREARGHRVRIGIVLQQDADPVLPGEEVSHLLDANPQKRAVHLGAQDIAHGAPEHHGAHVRVVGQGRRPGALVHHEDGYLGRHLEDRLQDPSQARPSPGSLRGHEHHEIARREVRAPIEARVVQRAGQRAGVLTGQTRARLSVAHEEDPGVRVAEVPWKRRNRKSVGHTTTRRMGGP